VLNYIHFIMSSMAMYFWFLYSEYQQNSSWIKKRVNVILLFIPILFVVILTFLSRFGHYIFYINEEGHYARGPLYSMHMVINFLYLLVTSIHAFYNALQRKNYTRKTEYFTIASFSIAPILFGVVQSIVPATSSLSVSITISVLIVFFALQEKQILLDELTHVYNKNYMNIYLDNLIEKCKENNEEYYFFMMDIDTYKNINSKHGMREGDNALVLTSKALNTLAYKYDFELFRFHYDEFVFVGQLNSEEYCSMVVQDVDEMLEETTSKYNLPYRLTMSCGYVKFPTEYNTVLDIIIEAEKRMKNNKK